MVNIQNKHIILLAFLFLFIGFLTTSNITGNPVLSIFKQTVTNSCYDSDNGLNYLTYGCITYNGKDYCDTCTGAYIKEYYCYKDKPLSKSGRCSAGCLNGACIPIVCGDGKCNQGYENQYSCPADCKVIPKIICTDSDGGNDYYVNGQTCVGSDCKKDTCSDTKGLMEYYCQNTSDRGSEYYICSNGCKDGACIQQIERCSSGQYKCEKDINGKLTNWAQKCDSNGYWYNAQYCNYGCDSGIGQCKQSTNKCTAGTKCYSTKYIGYQNADCTWSGLRYCSNGCFTGKTGIPSCGAPERLAL